MLKNLESKKKKSDFLGQFESESDKLDEVKDIKSEPVDLSMFKTSDAELNSD